MDNWMSEYGSMPLNELIIPSSHNSGTYNISAASRISPDSPTPLAALVPCIVAPISKCQGLNILQQLNCGIRIFDLRICYRGLSQWIVHGQYSVSLRDALKNVDVWLDTHPKEVVIIITRYLDGVDLNPLINYIGEERTAKYPGLNPKSKLSEFWTNKTNCVVIADCYGADYIWPSFDTITSTWCNKQDVEELKSWQDNDLPVSYGNNIWVAQLILTPTFLTVIRGGIPYSFAGEIDAVLLQWITQWKSEKKALNAIMLDFAGCNDNVISQLIKMNSLLI